MAPSARTAHTLLRARLACSAPWRKAQPACHRAQKTVTPHKNLARDAGHTPSSGNLLGGRWRLRVSF